MTPYRALGCVGALAMAAGCTVGVEEGRPLEISLTAAQTTAAVDEEIGFQFEASGRALLGVMVTYGDGAVDSVPAMGAVTARATLGHAYSVAGTYTVTAIVDDAFARSARDDVSVQIQ